MSRFPLPRKNNATPPEAVATIIGAETRAQGTLTSEEDITVYGDFEGEIFCKAGTVTIAKNASVQARIESANLIVSGVLDGEISCTELVELQSSAKFTGTIVCRDLLSAQGAKLQAKIETSNIEPDTEKKKKKHKKNES